MSILPKPASAQAKFDDGKYECASQHISGTLITYNFVNAKGQSIDIQIDTSKKDAKTFKVGDRQSTEELKVVMEHRNK